MLASLGVAIKMIRSRKIITRCLRKVSAPYDNHHPLRTSFFTVIVILSIYLCNVFKEWNKTVFKRWNRRLVCKLDIFLYSKPS